MIVYTDAQANYTLKMLLEAKEISESGAHAPEDQINLLRDRVEKALESHRRGEQFFLSPPPQIILPPQGAIPR